MKEKVENQKPESPTGETEKLIPRGSSNKILSASVQNILSYLIDRFKTIPYPAGSSKFPFAIVVPNNDNRFICLENEKLIDDAAQVRCLVLKVADTSEAALALLMTSLRMAGVCGRLSYAEQARNIRIIYDLHRNDADILVHSNGGDRRSRSFKEQDGEYLRTLLSRELDRPESVIENALHNTKFYERSLLEELVEKRATKRTFEALAKMRTAYIARPDVIGLPEEEKTKHVSEKIRKEWIRNYDAEKGEVMMPLAKIEPVINEDSDQVNAFIGSNAATDPQKSDLEPEPAEADITEDDADAVQKTKTDDEVDSGKPTVRGAAFRNADSSQEQFEDAGNSGNEGDDVDPESENDALPEAGENASTEGQAAKIFQLPSKRNWGDDQYALIARLGQELADLGINKVNPDDAVSGIRGIIADLFQLIAHVPKTQAYLRKYDQAANG